MNYLFVVAHPDDEILGAGATINNLVKQGINPCVCILSSQAEARSNRPSLEKLNEDINTSLNLLGVKKIIKGDFPNIEFNTVPHIKLVNFIENAINETKPIRIFTHHPGDLNNDHFQTSIACQAAARLFQRRPEIPSIKELLFMEIPSSTEWALNKSLREFSPNVFIEVGEDAVDIKIEALSYYSGVMRKYPHPRSKEALKGLATFRGSQAGMFYAEAFESAFRRDF